MQSNLICIESPLQLLNAYEAIKYFNIQNYQFIIRYSNSNTNDKQIKKLIDILKIDPMNIEEVKINTSNKSLLDLFKLFIYKYIFNTKKFNKVFIGNYRSGFFSLIQKSFDKDQVILLDDGAKTINIQKQFTDDLNYNLFTMYNVTSLKNQKIYINHFNNIQMFFEKKLVLEDNKILFLGSKLSEMDIISKEYYLELMNKISQYYKYKNIIYIAHREEDKNKLTKISKINNIKIKTIDYPVEIFGLFENKLPKTVSSFYSSALMTMQMIYRINPEAFYFDYKGSMYEKSIDNVYTFYENKMKIINLEPYV